MVVVRSKLAAAVRRKSKTFRGWKNPRCVRRFAEQLMTQQLWCWGRDIRSPVGNLLLMRGFERFREPGKGSGGATCYRLDEDGLHLALWGFGIFIGHRRDGGLFVDRYEFSPVWAPFDSIAIGIHHPKDLPAMKRPSTGRQWQMAHRLCHRLFEWLTIYEEWVIGVAGAEHRRRCVRTWLHPFLAAEDMSAAWRLLRSRCWDQGIQHWHQRVQRLQMLPKNSNDR